MDKRGILLGFIIGMMCLLGISRGAHIQVEDQQQPGDVPVNCFWCQIAVQTIQKLLASSIKSEAQLLNFTMQLCENGIKNDTMCKMYVPMLVSLIWHERTAPPKEICSQKPLNLCTNSGHGNNDAKFLGKFGFENMKNTISCDVCHIAVEELRNFVVKSEVALEQDIIDFICDNLPETPRNKCESAIKQDLPKLVEKYLDPKVLCQVIKACP